MIRKKKLYYGSGFLVLLVASLIVWTNFPDPVRIPKNLTEGERKLNRRIRFEGSGNFRDIGGYLTEEGRRVKWGVLYRSGDLSQLSRHDLYALSDLDLSMVVDFRAGFEREEKPDRFPSGNPIQQVFLPILDENSQIGKEMKERIENENMEGFDPVNFLTTANVRFATEFTPMYKSFFDTLLVSEGEPVLFHCTSGKDRTGFGAAVILRMLGVPMETIYEDYMLSKEYSINSRKKDLLMIRLFKGKKVAEIIKVMLGVEKPYLEAAFAAIDREYGSFENYLENGLELDEKDISILKGYWLE